MSVSPTLWNRTAGALAGAAVDAMRDLTVSQLDQVADGLHQRLTNNVARAPATTPSTVLTPPVPGPGMHVVTQSPTNRASAVIAGALIGIGVAVLFATRR